jgi:hypothetical protein
MLNLNLHSYWAIRGKSQRYFSNLRCAAHSVAIRGGYVLDTNTGTRIERPECREMFPGIRTNLA